MKKWKCKKCGEIYESELKPTKCTACESDEFEEVKEGGVENTTEGKNNNEILEMLRKQNENVQKQIDLLKTSYEGKIKDLETKLQDKDKTFQSETQLKELEKQKIAERALNEQSEILKQYEETKKRLEELEKANKIKEFENRKLRDKNQYYYIADKIEKCDTPEELDFLYKFTDLKKEKARFDAEKNGSGSVLNIAGTKSAEDVKPITVGQKLQEKFNKRLEEIANKKK